jgi:uncharacterized protein
MCYNHFKKDCKAYESSSYFRRSSLFYRNFMNTLDPKLLEILICPVTKGPLRYDAEKQELISERAKLAYPIRDGIPIMLPDEARRLDDAA